MKICPRCGNPKIKCSCAVVQQKPPWEKAGDGIRILHKRVDPTRPENIRKQIEAMDKKKEKLEETLPALIDEKTGLSIKAEEEYKTPKEREYNSIDLVNDRIKDWPWLWEQCPHAGELYPGNLALLHYAVREGIPLKEMPESIEQCADNLILHFIQTVRNPKAFIERVVLNMGEDAKKKLNLRLVFAALSDEKLFEYKNIIPSDYLDKLEVPEEVSKILDSDYSTNFYDGLWTKRWAACRTAQELLENCKTGIEDDIMSRIAYILIHNEVSGGMTIKKLKEDGQKALLMPDC